MFLIDLLGANTQVGREQYQTSESEVASHTKVAGTRDSKYPLLGLAAFTSKTKLLALRRPSLQPSRSKCLHWLNLLGIHLTRLKVQKNQYLSRRH